MNTNPHIKEIHALKRQLDSDIANKLLIKLSNHVHQIMTNRKYKVSYLKEFYPKNKQLLGLNMNWGYCIKIRLRHWDDKNRFLEFNELLGTLLHELVHIKISPHDNRFYKLLGELWTEYENQLDAGFRPDGTRLEGRQLDNHDRLKMLEKRMWLGGLMGPAQKLGGTRIEASPAEAVRLATLKRIEDNKRCQHIHIDLTLEEDDQDEYEPDSTLSQNASHNGQLEDDHGVRDEPNHGKLDIIDLTDESDDTVLGKAEVIIID